MTLDHHDEATANAMRVVARGLIADAVSEWVTTSRYPTPVPDPDGLAEMDAMDVMNIALAMTEPPTETEYAAAVEHLTKRGQG